MILYVNMKSFSVIFQLHSVNKKLDNDFIRPTDEPLLSAGRCVQKYQ